MEENRFISLYQRKKIREENLDVLDREATANMHGS
jgi:hypothetical protein